MQRSFRLTRPEDFKRVRQLGISYAHPLVVLVTQVNDQARLRVGVSAGRAVGNAVKRNRAKRLLREAMRPLIPSLATGWDLILIARTSLTSSSFFDVREALLSLLRRAKLIIPSDAD